MEGSFFFILFLRWGLMYLRLVSNYAAEHGLELLILLCKESRDCRCVPSPSARFFVSDVGCKMSVLD